MAQAAPTSTLHPPAFPTAVPLGLTGKTVAIAKVGDITSDVAVNLCIAFAILLFTLWLSQWASRVAATLLKRWPRTHKDLTLQAFVGSLARYAVLILGLIAILRRLGVETASIITVLGAASLAVGLALQGTLTNVAAGVMLLMLRPYQVGDTVTIAGKTGTVARLDLFNSELRDGDNLKIVVPNSKAFGDLIINMSDLETRRMELTFGIGYDDDIGEAIVLLLKCCEADPRILTDPAPWANVTDLAASAVTLTLRAWAKTDVYWEARYAMLRRVKETFQAARIDMPYPTQVSINKTGDPPPQPAQPEPAPPPDPPVYPPK
jgi:small conductance mechanosensitive channel